MRVPDFPQFGTPKPADLVLGYDTTANATKVMRVDTLTTAVAGWVSPAATGLGVSDDRAAFVAADTTALTLAAGIGVNPGTYRIASNLTITSPIRFVPGAILKPDAGVTVTLNGRVYGQMSQHFNTSAAGSAIVFGPGTVTAVYPEWWGADPLGSVNSVSAIQAAIAVAQGNLQRRVILSGIYKVQTTGLVVTDSLIMEGIATGAAASSVSLNNYSSTITLDVRPNNAAGPMTFQFRGFNVSGGTYGINFSSAAGTNVYRDSYLRDITIGSCATIGLRINNVEWIGAQWQNLNIENTGSYGLWAEGDAIFTACTIIGMRCAGATVQGTHLKQTVASEWAASTFIGCIHEYNTGGGTYTCSVRSIWHGCWWEGNGSAAGEADIIMDSQLSARNEMILHAPYFSSAQAAQANRRIRFAAALQHLVIVGGHSSGSEIIDAANFTTSSAITQIGQITPYLINNYNSNANQYGSATTRLTNPVLFGFPGTTVGIYYGTGTPQSVLTAAVGSLYVRTDGAAGTSLYVKESGTGNTGWTSLPGIRPYRTVYGFNSDQIVTTYPNNSHDARIYFDCASGNRVLTVTSTLPTGWVCDVGKSDATANSLTVSGSGCTFNSPGAYGAASLSTTTRGKNWSLIHIGSGVFDVLASN